MVCQVEMGVMVQTVEMGVMVQMEETDSQVYQDEVVNQGSREKEELMVAQESTELMANQDCQAWRVAEEHMVHLVQGELMVVQVSKEHMEQQVHLESRENKELLVLLDCLDWEVQLVRQDSQDLQHSVVLSTHDGVASPVEAQLQPCMKVIPIFNICVTDEILRHFVLEQWLMEVDYLTIFGFLLDQS